MNEGIHVYVDLPIQIRVENLIADYLKVSLSEIKNRKVNIDSEILKDFKESMNLLDKYSNKNNMEEYRTLFKNAEYERLAEVLIMNYYDPKYLNSMGKHNFEFKFELNNLNEFLIELKGVYKLLKK